MNAVFQSPTGCLVLMLKFVDGLLQHMAAGEDWLIPQPH